MALMEQIDADIKTAMKARDTVTLETLRMLKSAVKYSVIETKGADGAADDADVVATARKQIKMRQDTITSYEQAGRAVDKERQEIAVLEKFLPAQMPAAELEALVRAALAEGGFTTKAQMGQAMKAVMAKVAGRADGKAVNAVVAKLLA